MLFRGGVTTDVWIVYLVFDLSHTLCPSPSSSLTPKSTSHKVRKSGRTVPDESLRAEPISQNAVVRALLRCPTRGLLGGIICPRCGTKAIRIIERLMS